MTTSSDVGCLNSLRVVHLAAKLACGFSSFRRHIWLKSSVVFRRFVENELGKIENRKTKSVFGRKHEENDQ